MKAQHTAHGYLLYGISTTDLAMVACFVDVASWMGCGTWAVVLLLSWTSLTLNTKTKLKESLLSGSGTEEAT